MADLKLQKKASVGEIVENLLVGLEYTIEDHRKMIKAVHAAYDVGFDHGEEQHRSQYRTSILGAFCLGEDAGNECDHSAAFEDDSCVTRALKAHLSPETLGEIGKALDNHINLPDLSEAPRAQLVWLYNAIGRWDRSADSAPEVPAPPVVKISRMSYGTKWQWRHDIMVCTDFTTKEHAIASAISTYPDAVFEYEPE